MSKEEIVVYWSIASLPNRQTTMNMLVSPPVPVKKIFPKSDSKGEDSYRSCFAYSEMWNNIFAVLHPHTSTVSVEGPLDNPVFTRNDDNMWLPFKSALDGYRLDFDISVAFFCEESLIAQVTPPYMHDTSDKVGARIASGSFDISKWFRPINFTYLLWPKETSVTVTEGDPGMYIQFLTDKKVVLKHFEYTWEIESIAQQLTGFKNIKKFESLPKLYDRFIRGNINKRLLKLIKDNILE